MNAFKGDTILAPGGNGLVGRFITQLNQKYSHCGIMTRNFDEITHCTSSEDRIKAYPVGSIICGGPEPENLPDPEGGTNYSMQDFNAGASGEMVGGNWIIVPSVVVQPDPKFETRELRLRLHAVADDALAQKDKMHYRLYGYTDPTIEQTEVAPSRIGLQNAVSDTIIDKIHSKAVNVSQWTLVQQSGMLSGSPRQFP